MAKILLVDDDEATRKLYRDMITRMGHEVFAAETVEEAKSIISSEKDLDVALVDRMLSGGEDGLDVLKCIQTSQPLCQAVMVSGYPSFSSAAEALRSNAFDYLAKPVEFAGLSKVIKSALKEKEVQEKRMIPAHDIQKSYDELMSRHEMLHHNMRSLLVGIIGFTNRLIDKTSLNKRQMEYCKQIQECSAQLENMIDAYLDLSQLERKPFRPNKTRFNFLSIARQARKTLHFLADKKNVQISLLYKNRPPAPQDVLIFEGDRMYLQNALDNLLKNAVEASPPDRQVKMEIKDSDDSLAVSIQNWGAVPEEIKPVFFEKYATAGKPKGMGLGTYMGKLVATAHGGDITCTSPREELTEVLMTLPLPKHH
jgi:signal transduction histidine kinase